jgi:two-component system sensor histidine kinase KdpD
MYFFVAVVNAALSFKAKDRNKKLRDKEEKEKAIAFYNTILNSLSHELRTPIATIIGSVDAMNEQNERLSVIHKNELMIEVSKAAFRLNQQVENLLGLSRLESGMVKLHLDWIDINELIHRVIQKRSQSKPSQIITFLPGENLPLFKLDAVLIEQVIFNLLQNAIMYTPEQAEITISTHFQNEKCRIIFMDNGPGFPASSIQSAFDKFYRIAQSNTTGTGLGLSIVKGFVEAHNGHVALTNNINGGACFLIEIPAETSFIENLKNEYVTNPGDR